MVRNNIETMYTALTLTWISRQFRFIMVRVRGRVALASRR